MTFISLFGIFYVKLFNFCIKVAALYIKCFSGFGNIPVIFGQFLFDEDLFGNVLKIP